MTVSPSDHLVLLDPVEDERGRAGPVLDDARGLGLEHDRRDGADWSVIRVILAVRVGHVGDLADEVPVLGDDRGVPLDPVAGSGRDDHLLLVRRRWATDDAGDIGRSRSELGPVT